MAGKPVKWGSWNLEFSIVHQNFVINRIKAFLKVLLKHA